METYICVLDIDQRDLRTKDENKLRYMKQKQFRLTGVWEYVHFLFFFHFAHYYIFWINTIFPGICFYTMVVDDYLNYLGNEFRWGLVFFDEVQENAKSSNFYKAIIGEYF